MFSRSCVPSELLLGSPYLAEPSFPTRRAACDYDDFRSHRPAYLTTTYSYPTDYNFSPDYRSRHAPARSSTSRHQHTIVEDDTHLASLRAEVAALRRERVLLEQERAREEAVLEQKALLAQRERERALLERERERALLERERALLERRARERALVEQRKSQEALVEQRAREYLVAQERAHKQLAIQQRASEQHAIQQYGRKQALEQHGREQIVRVIRAHQAEQCATKECELTPRSALRCSEACLPDAAFAPKSEEGIKAILETLGLIPALLSEQKPAFSTSKTVPAPKATPEPKAPEPASTPKERDEPVKVELEIKDVFDFIHSLFGSQVSLADKSAESASSPAAVAPKNKDKGKAKATSVEVDVQQRLEERLQTESDQEMQDMLTAILNSLKDQGGPDVPGASSSKVKIEQAPKLEHTQRADLNRLAAAEEMKSRNQGASSESAAASRPSTPSSPVDRITSIRASLNSLTASFAFPSALDFDADSAELTFTPANAPLRAYEHALNGLLAQLDAVESDGDDSVRERRREAVHEVEAALARVDVEVGRQRSKSPVSAKDEEVKATEEEEVAGYDVDGPLSPVAEAIPAVGAVSAIEAVPVEVISAAEVAPTIKVTVEAAAESTPTAQDALAEATEAVIPHTTFAEVTEGAPFDGPEVAQAASNATGDTSIATGFVTNDAASPVTAVEPAVDESAASAPVSIEAPKVVKESTVDPSSSDEALLAPSEPVDVTEEAAMSALTGSPTIAPEDVASIPKDSDVSVVVADASATLVVDESSAAPFEDTSLPSIPSSPLTTSPQPASQSFLEAMTKDQFTFPPARLAEQNDDLEDSVIIEKDDQASEHSWSDLESDA